MRGHVLLVGAFFAAAGACAKPYLPVRADRPPPPAVPAGVKGEAWTFTGDGGVGLYARSWKPAEGEVRAVLIVQHGLRDHGDRYAPFAARLAQRGYAVYAADLRGHGRSAGRRVTIGSFDEYLDDFDAFYQAVRAREPGKPVFVMGHSMGGAIVLLWTEERGRGPAGVITSAPAIRVDTAPLVAGATILSGTLTPNVGQLAPDNRFFSSDPAVEADMGRDPLIFQPGGPVHTAAGLVGAMERVWDGVDRLTEPLLLLHGTGDHLTAPAGSRELYLRAPSSDKTLRLYDGLAHDLVHEPGADVGADVLAWLDAHTGGPPAAFPQPDLQRRLRGDAARPAVSFAMEAAYRRADTNLTVQFFGGGLRSRVQIGRRAAWDVGVDAEILDAHVMGGDDLTYRADLFPLGIGFRCPCGNNVSLSLGGGVSEQGGGADLELGAALDGEAQLGPVRALVWGRLYWVRGSADRDEGTSLGSLADELRLGVAVRLGRNHHFWSTANAGAGPYLGVTLDQLGGANVYGVALGIHMWGGD